MKSQKQLELFTAYCKEHPEERFWQSLRNWSDYDKIVGKFWNEEDEYEEEDTFYKE